MLLLLESPHKEYVHIDIKDLLNTHRFAQDSVCRLLLFGGQGSLKDLFSPAGTSAAIHNSKSYPAAAIILSTPNAMPPFLRTFKTWAPTSQRRLGLTTNFYCLPKSC